MLRQKRLTTSYIGTNLRKNRPKSSPLLAKTLRWSMVIFAFSLMGRDFLQAQPLPLPTDNKRTVAVMGTSFGYRPERVGNRVYHEGFWSIHGAIAPVQPIRVGFRYMVIGAYTFPRRFGDYRMYGPYLQIAPLNTRVFRLQAEAGYYMGDFCFCSLSPPPPKYAGLRYWNIGGGMEIHLADAVSLTLSYKRFKIRPLDVKNPSYSQIHLGLNYRFRVSKGLF